MSDEWERFNRVLQVTIRISLATIQLKLHRSVEFVIYKESHKKIMKM